MRRSIVLAAACSALAFGGAIVAAACSSDSSEAAPSRPPVTPPGTDSATDGGPNSEAGEDAACTGEAGCFACEPVQELDFLNECTDGLCTPFDNAARLPLYKPGQPLPAIP